MKINLIDEKPEIFDEAAGMTVEFPYKEDLETGFELLNPGGGIDRITVYPISGSQDQFLVWIENFKHPIVKESQWLDNSAIGIQYHNENNSILVVCGDRSALRAILGTRDFAALLPELK